MPRNSLHSSRARRPSYILLDLFALAAASRTVASQHARLRSAQWRRVRAGSALAREVQGQAAQVVLGVRAAAALVARLWEDRLWEDRSGSKEDRMSSREATDWGGAAPAADADAEKILKSSESVESRTEDGVLKKLPPDINVNVFRTKRGANMLMPEDIEDIKSKQKNSFEDMLKSVKRSDSRTASVSASESQLESPLESTLESPLESPLEPTESLSSSPSSLPSSDLQNKVSTESKKYQLRESRVPATRFGRIWEYSGLATSMAFGAVGESLRRVAGSSSEGSLVLGPKNMERLVSKLSRMRGAALKLGQMISFQDSKMLPPAINEVLLRVQDAADYMPPSQRDSVLSSDLGPNWRELFSQFDEMPIAAASIGQVHRAIYKATGEEVAIKIQYPGVARSIDSDLNNLSILLTASRLLPKGLFLDRTIANARTELAWECDYEREAKAAQTFKTLLADDDAFSVPGIVPEACGKQVLTAQFMRGVAVTKMPYLPQDARDWIGTQILRLCLREITEFNFMQTDPNWTNFLYNSESEKLELLDFGASRSFPKTFIEPYVATLRAAAQGDKDTVARLSVSLGYLTGSEGSTMRDAHVSSILTLAEPFTDNAPELYEFGTQTITDRVREFIPVMLRERLAPPPEETYSLHRKLSGAFLLCARLGSRVRCRELWRHAMEKYDSSHKK